MMLLTEVNRALSHRRGSAWSTALSLLLVWGCEPPKPEPVRPDFHGFTAIHYAAQNNDVEALKAILSQPGGDPNVRDAERVAPIHRAARDGYLEVVRTLLAYGADPELRTASGWTAAQLAARQGHLAIVRLLESQGADLKAKTPDGRSLLHLASARYNAEMIGFLLEKGLDPNEPDPKAGGKCPIHRAVEKQDIFLVTALLDHGADINAATPDGQTPYAIAYEAQQYDFVNWLYARGAR